VRYAHEFLYGIDIASLIDERCRLRRRFLFYAGGAGERAQRAITKMPRSAPIKSRQLSAVGRQPGRTVMNDE
jgi:hypothetical protein